MSREHFELNLCSSPSIFSKCVLKKHSAPERSVLQAKSLSLSLRVSLCECASAAILTRSGLFIYGGLTEEQAVLSIPAKEPLHDRGEEVE